MSKKRRKRRPRARSQAPAPPAAKAAEVRPARNQVTGDERPPAPWGSFPLVELVVLIGLIMVVAGFVIGGVRGTTMIAVGLALGALAGLELSIREHFAGYRSHTTLLSGTVGIAVLIGLAFLAPSLWLPIALGIAVTAFGATAWVLARAFRRRSGLAFKVR
jgi:hypothetical protein